MTESQAHILEIFSIVIGVAVALQCLIMAVLALAGLKLLKVVTQITEEVKPKVYPLMDSARDIAAKAQVIAGHAKNIAGQAEDLVADTKPKIQRVTTNIVETSDVYRAKLAEVDALVTDTTQKARRQSDRVDDMVTHALTSVGSMVGHVEEAIMTPVRRVAGFFGGLRGGTEHFIRNFTARAEHVAEDLADTAEHAVHDLKESAENLVDTVRHRRPATPRPVAFEGESSYTGLEDDYHA